MPMPSPKVSVRDHIRGCLYTFSTPLRIGRWGGGGGGGVQDRSSCFSVELFRCLDLCTFFRTFSNPRLDPVTSD